ncbi:MAG: hypothetical protein RLN96_09980, partial [Pseudomonadales bacterium]
MQQSWEARLLEKNLMLFTKMSPLLLAGMCVCASSQAQQPPLPSNTLGFGAYYARGDYGEPSDTEILYLPVSYQRSVGNWGFQLLVPYLEVTGLGNVLVNIGGVTRAVAGTEEM